MTGTPATTLVLYDGVCGLCDRLVMFLLPRDRQARFRFAPLQSALAADVLRPHGLHRSSLDTVYVIADWRGRDERVFARSRAILHCLAELGGGWRLAARAARLVPRPVADSVYRTVARMRYRVFGQFETCPLPRPEWRARFLATTIDD